MEYVEYRSLVKGDTFWVSLASSRQVCGRVLAVVDQIKDTVFHNSGSRVDQFIYYLNLIHLYSHKLFAKFLDANGTFRFIVDNLCGGTDISIELHADGASGQGDRFISKIVLSWSPGNIIPFIDKEMSYARSSTLKAYNKRRRFPGDSRNPTCSFPEEGRVAIQEDSGYADLKRSCSHV
jgi:hypothetical protein